MSKPLKEALLDLPGSLGVDHRSTPGIKIPG
jgi:hypothetical protein